MIEIKNHTGKFHQMLMIDSLFEKIVIEIKSFIIMHEDRSESMGDFDLLELIEIDKYSEKTGKAIFVLITDIPKPASLFDYDGESMIAVSIRKLKLREIKTLEISRDSEFRMDLEIIRLEPPYENID
jgi:hypothetical protein